MRASKIRLNGRLITAEAAADSLIAGFLQGDIERTYELAQCILRQMPSHFDALQISGLIALQQGRPEQAKSYLERAIKIDPTHAGAKNALGNAVLALGNTELAGAFFSQSLALSPDYIDPLFNLANLKLIHTAEKGEAESLYREVLVQQPKHQGALCNLALLLQDQNRPLEAMELIRQLLAECPAHPEGLAAHGQLLSATHHWEEAESSFKQALSLEPARKKTWNNYGNLLKDQGRYCEAESAYKKALELDATYLDALINLAVLDIERWELAEAKRKFAAIQEKIGNPEAIRKHLIQYAKSAAEFEIALQLIEDQLPNAEPKPSLWVEAADAAALLGNGDKARQFLDSAYARGVDRENIKAQTGSLNQQLENLDNCITLMPVGRSGSLFLHALFDAHPDIATLPSVYFKGFFNPSVWRQLYQPGPQWRQVWVENVCKTWAVLFDSRIEQGVPGNPIGGKTFVGRSTGLASMGPNRDLALKLPENRFREHLLQLLAEFESLTPAIGFKLLHIAFDRTLQKIGSPKALFYHIHNPSSEEYYHFRQAFPGSKNLWVVREPVQALESWLRMGLLSAEELHELTVKNGGNRELAIVQSYGLMNSVTHGMFNALNAIQLSLQEAYAVRLEDVKRQPEIVLPALQAWMGVRDHPVSREATFQGVQYWGPSSKASPNLKGFDTSNLDRRVGILFSGEEAELFATLFAPVSERYGYDSRPLTKARLNDAHRQLGHFFAFERHLAEHLGDAEKVGLERLRQSGIYDSLRRLLRGQLDRLEKTGDYAIRVPLLPLQEWAAKSKPWNEEKSKPDENDLAAWLIAAGKALDTGDLNAASNGFKRVLVRIPNQADALRGLALVEQKLGHGAAAIDQMRAAIAALQALPTAQQLTALHAQWLKELAVLLIQNNQPAVATEALEQSLRLQPNQPDVRQWLQQNRPQPNTEQAMALAQQGEECREKGHWAQAEHMCQQALSLVPELPDALAVQALMRVQEEKWEEARGLATRVLNASATCHPLVKVAAWRALASCRLKTGDMTGAEEGLQEALRIVPEEPRTLALLGGLRLMQGRLSEAEALCSRAIAVGNVAEGYANRSVARLQGGNATGAEEDAREALRLKPFLAMPKQILLKLYLDQRRWQEGEFMASQVIAERPADWFARAVLVECLRQQRKLDEAQGAGAQLVELHPQRAEAWTAWGAVLHEQGDETAALQAYQKALVIDPAQASIHNNLARIYQDRQDFPAAKRCLEQALALQPNNIEFAINLARIEGALALHEQSYRLLEPHLAANHPEATRNALTALQLSGTAEASALAHRLLPTALKQLPEPKPGKTTPGLAEQLARLENVVALIPYARSGSLFVQSLLDGHPAVTTLPGVYLKGFFQSKVWATLYREGANWRSHFVQAFCMLYPVLFDAACPSDVPGSPMNKGGRVGEKCGLTRMGESRNEKLILDQQRFSSELLALLEQTDGLSPAQAFQLVHLAYERTLGRTEEKQLIFYHIHNPDEEEYLGFIRAFPRARTCLLVRDPVQALESWIVSGLPSELEKCSQEELLHAYRKVVGVITMSISRLPNRIAFEANETVAIRLEDIKGASEQYLPQWLNWMGVDDHPETRKSSFQAMAYWGPVSRLSPDLRGFDQSNLQRKIGAIFSEDDESFFTAMLAPLRYRWDYDISAPSVDDFTQAKDWLKDGIFAFERLIAEHYTGGIDAIRQTSEYEVLRRTLGLELDRLIREGDFSVHVGLLFEGKA